MSPFNLLQGTYFELFAIMLPEFSTVPTNPLETRAIIDRDLNRTAFSSRSSDIECIKTRLISEFLQHSESNIYLQGDFEACLGYTHFYSLPQTLALFQELANRGEQQKDYIEYSRICYENDHGQLCGLCVFIFRDDSSQNSAKAPLFRFNITICENVTGLPHQRKVTCLSDRSLIQENISTVELNLLHSLNIVKNALHSEHLYQALLPILMLGCIGPKFYYDQFASAIFPNRNNYQTIMSLFESIRHFLDPFLAIIEGISNEINQRLKRYYLQRLALFGYTLMGIAAVTMVFLFAEPIVVALAALALVFVLFMDFYTLRNLMEDEDPIKIQSEETMMQQRFKEIHRDVEMGLTNHSFLSFHSSRAFSHHDETNHSQPRCSGSRL